MGSYPPGQLAEALQQWGTLGAVVRWRDQVNLEVFFRQDDLVGGRYRTVPVLVAARQRLLVNSSRSNPPVKPLINLTKELSSGYVGGLLALF